MISRVDRLSMFLESHFGEVSMHTNGEVDAAQVDGRPEGLKLVVNVDGIEASIDLLTLVRLLAVIMLFFDLS
jgi:hypothetical protein